MATTAPELMLWHFPPMRAQVALTAAWFLSAAALFAAGTHLSYANVIPQQARIKAHSDFVRDNLHKKYGCGGDHQQRR